MSAATKVLGWLASELGDVGESVLRRVAKGIGKDATEAEVRAAGRAAYDRIMKETPEGVDFAAKKTRAATAPAKAAATPANPKFSVSARQAAAAKARAQEARATKTKYAAVEPHPDPHPELADFEFPQGAGLGGPHAIEFGVPIVGRRPFMAQSNRGYSGISSSMPANRVVGEVTPFVDLGARTIRTPEETAKRFAAGIPLTGDKLRVGDIKQVNDRPQVGSARARGGPDFPRLNLALGSPDAWASLDSVVSTLDNMRETGENLYGGPVAGVYTAMGNTGLDQSTAMMDLLGRQLAAGGVTQVNLKKLDSYVKKLLGGDYAKEFVGFAKDPIAAAEQLNNISRVQMPKRTAIIQALDSANAMTAGFPDIGANRAVATVPELLYAPEGSSGYMISELSGAGRGALSNAADIEHPNYPKRMTGEYFGGWAHSVPRELMFSDYFKAMHGSGYDPVQVHAYLFSRTPKEIKEAFGSDPRIQQFNQEWVDRNSKYLEDIEKYGPVPYAKGGLAVNPRRGRSSAPRSLAVRNPNKVAPKGHRAGKTR